MIQVSSSNLTVPAATTYTLSNVSINKGCAERMSGSNAIALEKRGIYLVEADGYCTPSAAGTVLTQLYVNGVAQSNAQSSFTGETTTIGNWAFKTLVQVSENNCNCNCYTNPTILQFMNGETAIGSAYINVVVTKIC